MCECSYKRNIVCVCARRERTREGEACECVLMRKFVWVSVCERERERERSDERWFREFNSNEKEFSTSDEISCSRVPEPKRPELFRISTENVEAS